MDRADFGNDQQATMAVVPALRELSSFGTAGLSEWPIRCRIDRQEGDGVTTVY
ncbi:hypothetical protein AB0M35_11870 [Micromonospora sp. NPDC051196]|uniref:hypothetical protein n=1 Tax=Micromonospora sp. NPDC051196 TaxID=3155281 RepID=UPI00344A9D48